MPHTPRPSVPEAPIVSIGPSGTTFLSIDPTADMALEHLADHGIVATGPNSGGGAATSPITLDEVTMFDRRGRRLGVEHDDDGPRLVVEDRTDRRGELAARIEEAFAHARVRAYCAEDRPDFDPTYLRPPEPPALPHPAAGSPRNVDETAWDDFLTVLCDEMSFERPDEGPADHAGSWWHNLFH